MEKKLLIVEDEKSVSKQLRWGLADEYDVTIAEDAEKARNQIATKAFPVITLDLGLPPFPDSPKQGFELLAQVAELSPHSKVIVITGNAEKENAMKAIAMGATDFYAKPIDLNILKIILERTFHIKEYEEANRALRKQASMSGSLCNMIGVSQAMTALFDRVKQAANTDYPVLITGSTGTGKEVTAKAIHELSPRSDKPLVTVNCGAIPENLIESELFGHEKGAFTGAATRQLGKFEQAEGGTIFLDEIGELPLQMQVKLLRVLQESTIERLGGSKTIALDIRVLAATNRDLENEVQNGSFREDLFYRLNVVSLAIPDIQERQDDILLLAHSFLQEESEKMGRGNVSFSPATIAALTTHGWPGNVREIQNRIRRALGSTLDNIIQPQDLGFEETRKETNAGELTTLKEAREKAEKVVVHQALSFTGNNISTAAKILGVSRPTLHDLIKKHKIELQR